jgi:hypothetical protein
MSNDDKNAVSAGQAGSADDLIKNSPSPNDGGSGELVKTQPSIQGNNAGAGNADTVSKVQYEEAEKKLGEQGRELGEFRTFFKEVSPLLDKLQSQPELVEAIMEGRIDASLAQAVLDNKVKIEDAENITKAHDEVKKDLGTGYEKKSSADIEKMVAEKVGEITKKLEDSQETFKRDIKSSEERRKFEGTVESFISKTEDFSEYAKSINTWLEDHPDIYDIETAYYAVKGKALATKKAEEDEISKAEAAKLMAANAGSGSSQGARIIQDKSVADSLISSTSNPNAL